MPLPMLERYTLDQAISFIERRLGERISKDELLEYAMNGHLNIAIFIHVVGDNLLKIGNEESKYLKLKKWESPILHNKNFPIYGNPKSYLHKKIASFSDGLIDIQAGFFMCDDSEDLRFNTQETKEGKYPLYSFLMNGNLSVSGYVYLLPEMLNKIQRAIRDKGQ